MTIDARTAALVALLREGRHGWTRYAAEVAAVGVEAVLDAELGLLAGEAIERARAEIGGWHQRGIHLVSLWDDDYPANLSRVPERPPLLFIAGHLSGADDRSVAVVGARTASQPGRRAAGAIARRLCAAGCTVTSGLAEGVDTAAHEAALKVGGRTTAVVGSGLDHCYPARNAALQRRIALDGAVVSQFWPEARPSRQSFPMRNAVMAGLTLATVIVEASATSGTRIQARMALAAGRPVLLMADLLEQSWARELAQQRGAVVVHSPADAVAAVERRMAQVLVA
jgi:DNA processing protein